MLIPDQRRTQYRKAAGAELFYTNSHFLQKKKKQWQQQSHEDANSDFTVIQLGSCLVLSSSTILHVVEEVK